MDVTEELEVLRIVTERLEAAQVPYMVTGSFAANYYAVPRMTRDIDIVVELSAGVADRLCELFEPDCGGGAHPSRAVGSSLSRRRT